MICSVNAERIWSGPDLEVDLVQKCSVNSPNAHLVNRDLEVPHHVIEVVSYTSSLVLKVQYDTGVDGWNVLGTLGQQAGRPVGTTEQACQGGTATSKWDSHITMVQPHHNGTTTSGWNSHITMVQPHHGGTAISQWYSHITVEQPHHGGTATSWWNSHITVEQPHHGGTATSGWNSHITMVQPHRGGTAMPYHATTVIGTDQNEQLYM